MTKKSTAPKNHREAQAFIDAYAAKLEAEHLKNNGFGLHKFFTATAIVRPTVMDGSFFVYPDSFVLEDDSWYYVLSEHYRYNVFHKDEYTVSEYMERHIRSVEAGPSAEPSIHMLRGQEMNAAIARMKRQRGTWQELAALENTDAPEVSGKVAPRTKGR